MHMNLFSNFFLKHELWNYVNQVPFCIIKQSLESMHSIDFLKNYDYD